jgi:2'-5' RNA ligase
MRGFLGFPLAEKPAAELAALALPKGKKLLAPDLHLTIKFLSEFSQDSFVRTLPELCALGKPPVDFVIAGSIVAWPTVIALECEGNDSLTIWRNEVNELLERRGFIHERHPEFRPHITLARGKGIVPDAMAEAFRGRKIFLRAPALYRSEHEESGRRHREILTPLFHS